MNAAEITDKLGLHSLRQRAWVCVSGLQGLVPVIDLSPSTSNQPVQPLVMVSTKVWSGWATHSERLAIIRETSQRRQCNLYTSFQDFCPHISHRQSKYSTNSLQSWVPWLERLATCRLIWGRWESSFFFCACYLDGLGSGWMMNVSINSNFVLFMTFRNFDNCLNNDVRSHSNQYLIEVDDNFLLGRLFQWDDKLCFAACTRTGIILHFPSNFRKHSEPQAEPCYMHEHALLNYLRQTLRCIHKQTRSLSSAFHSFKSFSLTPEQQQWCKYIYLLLQWTQTCSPECGDFS